MNTGRKLSIYTLAISLGMIILVWGMLIGSSAPKGILDPSHSFADAQSVPIPREIPITGGDLISRSLFEEATPTPDPSQSSNDNQTDILGAIGEGGVPATPTPVEEQPVVSTETSAAVESSPTVEVPSPTAVDNEPSTPESPEGDIWKVEVEVPLSNQEMLQAGGVNAAKQVLENVLDAKVTDEEIQTLVETQNLSSSGAIFKVMLQGEDGVSQLKETIYEDLANQVNIIDGPSIIEISGQVVRGEEWPLKLHSNPSTGYMWRVVNADAEYFQVINESEIGSSNGIGKPEEQILRFRGVKDGETTLRLAYIRPWEPNVQYKNKITLQSQEPLHEVQDLSDPNIAASTEIETAALPLLGEIVSSTTVLGDGGSLGLPASFDWRSQGVVTTVKDQRSCGSCWAFGTVGVMESAILRAGGPITDLSEQYLINCNDYGYSCNGGWWAHDFHWNRYISPQTQAGAVLESALPYTAVNGSCSQAYNHPYRLASWAMIAGYTLPTVDQLKNAIYNYGPIAVAVCVGNAFQAYSGGIFSTNECTSVNHAVILTGWDDTNQYWVMKNSWGTGWGESGYMRIRWNTSNIGYAASYVVYNSPTPTVTSGGPTFTPTKTPTITLTPTKTNTPNSTTNDDFNYATNVVLNNYSYTASQFTNSATNAGDDPIIPCIYGTGYKTVWYRYVAPNNNPVTISTQGSNYDTVLAVWRGTRGSLSNIACNDDINYPYNANSQIITSLTAGQTYYIEVAGYYSDSYGLLQLNVLASGPTSTPTHTLTPTFTRTPTPTYTRTPTPTYTRTPTPTSTKTPTPTNTFTPTYTPTPPLPPSPRLIAPSGTITSTNSPDYQWAEVAGALEYYLEVYKSSMFQPISTSVSTAYCNGGVCTYPGIRLASGIYQFRVKARNQTGWGSFSAWKVFIIDYRQALLPPPSLISPNGIINTSTPSFQWNKVNGAEEYDLLVTSGLNGSVVINQRVSAANCSNDICSYTTVTPLAKGTYSFKVRSIDNQGRAGSYSSPLTFRVNVSSLTAPVNLLVEETSTYRPLFKWDKVAGATRYYLLVYRDNNGTYPLRAYVYAYNCVNQVCSYRAPRNLYQGNYRFKVRAYEGRDSSAYSDWKTFTIP